MRQSLAAALFSFFALAASAGTITSLDPSSIAARSGEHFLTIHGSGLGSRVVFDGPAGRFELDTNATFAGSVVVWIPERVVATAGTYDVSVIGQDGTTEPATFNVVGFMPRLVLILPEYLRIRPRSIEGAYVKYEVFTNGGDDTQPEVFCEPASGSFFKLGQTRVHCRAKNRYGESAEDSFIVNVRDEEPPLVEVPREAIVVKAESRDGAMVDFKTWAHDEIYGDIEPQCLPRSGSIFPIGTTRVQCSAMDLDLNVGHASFEVQVIGEREPYTLTLHVPEPISVEAESPEGAPVDYKVEVSGTDDPRPEVTCEPKSGSFFPIGDTTVRCDAIDAWGMRGSATFDVRVIDGRAPEIYELYVKPDALIADGELHPVDTIVRAVDNFDLAPVCEIVSVTSNEPIDVGDDEGKNFDWLITGPLTAQLRAKRFGDVRIYTLLVGCSDTFGNRSSATTDVRVIDGRPAKPSSMLPSGGKRRSVGSR